MTVYIVGNGAHGSDIARDFYAPVMLDDNPARSEKWPTVPSPFMVGINDPSTRRKVAERLEADGWTPALDRGLWVHPCARLSHHVDLGAHTHVNGMVFAVRCTIGDYTTVSPGVTICGDVTIGSEVFIGAGATICNLVKVGDRSVIGAGAVVFRDVPPDTTVVGWNREVIR